MLVCFYVAPTFNSYLICLASLFLCVSTELSYFYLYIYQHQYVVNFHQRYSTTSVSNTTKSFCVPWSWTNNLSCWNKSHRKNGGWLSTIPGFYSKTSSLNEMWKKSISPFLLKAICVTVAALMQYFLMAAFCWMLVEGIYLYLFVVKVYNINTKMHMYHAISWGILILQLN